MTTEKYSLHPRSFRMRYAAIEPAKARCESTPQTGGSFFFREYCIGGDAR